MRAAGLPGLRTRRSLHALLVALAALIAHDAAADTFAIEETSIVAVEAAFRSGERCRSPP